jgi:hypothetical protein
LSRSRAEEEEEEEEEEELATLAKRDAALCSLLSRDSSPRRAGLEDWAPMMMYLSPLKENLKCGILSVCGSSFFL